MSNSLASLPNESPGQWLTRQMNQADIGVRRLADALGVTEKAIYEWRGDRTSISEARVKPLADVLGVSEIEARRGLGYWTPGEGDGAKPARNPDELDEIIQDMTQVLERFRKWRRGV